MHDIARCYSTQMRLKRGYALAPVLALLALAPALGVHADSNVSVTITPRWGAPTPGTWNAYEVVVANSADATFSGSVVLAPAAAPYQSGGYSPADQYPHYSQAVTVAPQGQQKVEMMVYDAPFGYDVEVDDSNGHKVASAPVGTSSTAGYTVGVLSDVRGADVAVQGAGAFNYRVEATQFNGAGDFPKSVLDLSGLQALIIDGFDTGSLSQAQVRAIRDFAGLGGDLIIAGGSSWRRTLLALPPELVPLRPVETQDVSLQPLADLAGLTTTQTASVATGTVTGRSVLHGADGVPLVIESTYGAGRIVLLTYDPLADPIASDGALSELGWEQGLARSFGGAAVVAATFVGKGAPVPINGGGVVTGSGNGRTPGVIVTNNAIGSPQYADIFSTLLVDTPGASAPPLALIGFILFAYIVLTGPGAYLVLRAMKRRELMWATLPAAALVFTVASYGIGLGAHGTDFVDNSVELQRVMPNGAVQATTYQDVYSPQRGDHVIGLPPDTVVTTAFGSYSTGGGLTGRTTSADLVVVASRPELQLHGVAVWEPNSFQTLSMVQGSAGLEANLAYANKRVTGTIRNRTASVIRDVRFAATGFGETKLGDLQPGQMLHVSAPFTPQVGSGPIYSPGCVNTSSQSGREDCVLQNAAQWGGSLPGQLTLVGLTDRVVAITVDGANPHRGTIAAFAQPVTLSSSDAVVAGLGAPRLVSVYRGSSYMDAYDLDLPSATTGYSLKYVATNLCANCLPPASPVAGSVLPPEVYNWSAGTWRKLAAASSALAPLTADETSNGTVRIRVSEVSPGYYVNLASVVQRTQ